MLTFVFKVQRKGLPRDIFRHAEACDNVRVQSGTDPVDCPGLYVLYTLHMPKPVYNSRVQNATDGHASLRTATHKICPSPGPRMQAVPEHKRVATAESTRKRATAMPQTCSQQTRYRLFLQRFLKMHGLFFRPNKKRFNRFFLIKNFPSLVK